MESFIKNVEDGAYQKRVKRLNCDYMNFPRSVSIETLVKCNAKCTFCPYPESPRKGDRMSDGLFRKIINDLSSIPLEHQFSITLTRINEPLLDKRLKEFSKLIEQLLPNANQSFWSNGTMLNKGSYEWINEFKNASLNISLNSIDEDEHLKLMGFGLKKVEENLDHLHRIAQKNEWSTPVVLTASFISQDSSKEFTDYCKNRWPLFTLRIRPFFIWEGDSGIGTDEREASGVANLISDKVGKLACGQWFDLHVLANGFITKCCIDESGYNAPRYDTSLNHVLEIYEHSMVLRETTPSRINVSGCESCTHLG